MAVFKILLSTQNVKIFTKSYKLSFVNVSQCAVFSREELFVRGSNLKHQCRAILDYRPLKIGDVNCDDETPSIRRTHVLLGDWQKLGVVDIPDIRKGPITRNSLGLDKCKSIRSHNRPCRARQARDWPEAFHLPLQPRRLMSIHDGKPIATQCRHDAPHRNP